MLTVQNEAVTLFWFCVRPASEWADHVSLTLDLCVSMCLPPAASSSWLQEHVADLSRR